MTERITLPISPELLQQIDQWRRRQDDLPNRSEAIRRMVERVLDEDKAPS